MHSLEAWYNPRFGWDRGDVLGKGEGDDESWLFGVSWIL